MSYIEEECVLNAAQRELVDVEQGRKGVARCR